MCFSNIAIASNDYVSEQGRIREFDWRYLTSNDKYIRFESPEEFLQEADDLFTAYESKYNKKLKELKTNWFNFLNKQDNYKYNYREWREKFFARNKK